MFATAEKLAFASSSRVDTVWEVVPVCEVEPKWEGEPPGEPHSHILD